ncbi:MAG TPA: hypothetical protein VGB74_00245 [Actinoplanes sp.]
MTLAVLVLVPTGILFVRVWQQSTAERDSTKLEQQGVEYLGALLPLVSALAEFQSSALQGVAKPPDSLPPAVARVSAVDGRLGAALKTTERWAQLQDKIGKLATATGTPLDIVTVHVETSDLTLALFDAVRRNSELNRDPDSDISNLQQTVAVDMPTVITEVSLEGDYANILQNVTGTARDQVGVQLGQSALAVQSAVATLTNNLQAAVDDTTSTTLSGDLVNTLDAFRRGVEAMNRGANPGGLPSPATMATAQTTLQTALGSLSGVALREMDRLLDERLDTQAYRRAEAVGMAALVLLLVIGAVLVQTVGRRPAPTASPADMPGHELSRNVPPGGTAYGGYPYGQAPGYGEDDPTRRERFGALR